MQRDEHFVAECGEHHRLNVETEFFKFDDGESEDDEDPSRCNAKRLKHRQPDDDLGAAWWQEIEDSMSRNPIVIASEVEPNVELHVTDHSDTGAKRQPPGSPQDERPRKLKRPG